MGVSSDGNRMAVKFIEKSFGKPHKVNGNPTEGNNPNKFETRIEVYSLTTLQLFKQIVIKDPDVEVFVDEDVSFLIWSDKKVVKDYLPTYQGGYYGSLLDGESSKVVLEKNIKVKDFFASTIYLKRIEDHFFVWHRGKSPLAWNKDEPIYLSVFDKEFNILEQVPVSKEDETAYVLRHISKNGLWLLTAKKPLTEKFENEGGERQPEIDCKKAYALRYVGYDGAYIDTINYLPKVIDAVRSILPNQRITFKRSGIIQDEILFPVDVDFSNGKEYRYYTNCILKDFIGYTKNENFLYPENDLMVVPQSITQDTSLYYSTVNIRSMTKELDVPLATVRGYEPPASKPKVSYIKKRVVCFGCGGKGVYPTSGTQTCDVCNGARYHGGTCNACKGTGREQKFTRTTYVNGYTGQQYGSSTVNTGGFCRPCAGSGKVSGKCYNCGGLGVVGAPGPCPYCNSTGYRTEYTEVIEE